MRSVLLLATAASLALTAVPASAYDLPEIAKRGTLRVVTVDEDLFFSLKPGTPPGFDREVLEGFSQLHRLKLEVVPLTSWDTLIPALLEGKGDVLAGGYAITESRKKQIAFTSEVFPSRKVVMTRKPHRVVATVTDLRSEKVGTVKGTSMAEAVAAAGVPAANVVFVPSGTMPQALADGRVTAIVMPVEHAIRERQKDPAIHLGVFLGEPGSLAFGVRPGDRQLLKALNDYVENFRKTPTWGRLVVKYLGNEAPETLKKARAQ